MTAQVPVRSGWTLRVPERIILGFFLVAMIAYGWIGSREVAGRRIAKVYGIDAVAYFGIAHSLLFDRDFDLTNEFVRVPPIDRMWFGVQADTGKPGSPFALGYSLATMPMLAAGTLIDRVAGHPADGYGPFALLFYCETNLLLTCLGLVCVMRLLRRIAPWLGAIAARDGAVLFVAAAILFGTNVGVYAITPFSHAADFLALSMFLLLSVGRAGSSRFRDWLLLGLSAGFLAIVRWQEALYWCVPFVWAWFGPDRGGLRDWIRRTLSFAAGAVIFCAPQSLEWKTLYGKFITFPQGHHANGFFVFPPPFFLNVLFSTRSGWFVWTPLALLGCAGLLILARRLPRFAVPLLCLTLAQAALVGSSPVTWSGLDSFSCRYLTSAAAIVAIGLMALIATASPRARTAVVAAGCLCCAFTMLFMVQYRLDLVERDSRLTLSELFGDKLRLTQVYRRKSAIRAADALTSSGRSRDAIAMLQPLAAGTIDRVALKALARAYEAAGERDACARTRRALDQLSAQAIY